MTKDEIIAMAREAGFDMSNLPSIRASNVYGEVNDELERFAALVAAKAAADERERLFGKERDGDMRLMLHRWDQGRCWAAVTHFTAEQTRFGPSGVLDRAAERMSAEMDAAIRARSPQ